MKLILTISGIAVREDPILELCDSGVDPGVVGFCATLTEWNNPDQVCFSWLEADQWTLNKKQNKFCMNLCTACFTKLD